VYLNKQEQGFSTCKAEISSTEHCRGGAGVIGFYAAQMSSALWRVVLHYKVTASSKYVSRFV